jgi:Na+/melibiose symporter-like transporter
MGMGALAAPALPMFALMMPLTIFIPPFYAEHMGLGMAAVGTLFTLGRLFDVFTDPVAGVVMDRTQHIIGRHAWVTLGALPLALGTWQIFFAEPPGSAALLMFWLIVLYAGWTLMSVGLFSWGAEISPDYHERSRVMGAIQLANNGGTVLVLLLPVLIELEGGGADVALARVRAMGGFILTLLPITLALAWWLAPRPTAIRREPTPILPALKQAFGNPALRILLAADLSVGLTIGTFTALTVFFVEIVLGHAGRAGILQLILLASAFIGIPIWVRVAGHIQKHRTLAFTALFSCVGGVGALIIPPGQFALAALCYIFLGLASGAGQFLPRAIMADVLDQDRLASGEERAGLYFSFLTTTLKIGLALGVGITFWLAGLAGFDPAQARLDDSAHWVIRVLIGVIPIMLGLVTAALMYNFPFDRAQQTAARDALEKEPVA